MVRRLLRAWDRFWFEPVAPTSIALFRILFGLLLLAYGALMAPDFIVWLGQDGLLSRETARRWSGAALFQWMDLLPPGDGWTAAFFALFMAAAFSLTCGLFTRTSAALVFIGLSSIHHRNMFILNSGDTLFRMAAFLLLFSQAGAALSVDRLRKVCRGLESGPPAPRPPWAQRLLQIQVCILYLSSFLEKIQGSMWRDGTAVYYVARLEEFQRFPVPYLFDHMTTIRLVTWGTLAVELGMGVLVWVPRLRHAVLCVGLLLHLGLEYSMNVPLFQWVTLSTYLLFLEPQRLRQALRRLSAVLPIPAQIVRK